MKVNIEDPYKNIEFEVKHVKIAGADNVVVFEDDIEFPKDFDDNAAAVVASRYLCNDAKHKETSLKQMINRVSDTISEWGRELGYFVKNHDDEDNPDPKFIELNNKLKYYQINRYFAFNSPVNLKNAAF